MIPQRYSGHAGPLRFLPLHVQATVIGAAALALAAVLALLSITLGGEGAGLLAGFSPGSFFWPEFFCWP